MARDPGAGGWRSGCGRGAGRIEHSHDGRQIRRWRYAFQEFGLLMTEIHEAACGESFAEIPPGVRRGEVHLGLELRFGRIAHVESHQTSAAVAIPRPPEP